MYNNITHKNNCDLKYFLTKLYQKQLGRNDIIFFKANKYVFDNIIIVNSDYLVVVMFICYTFYN